MSRIRSIKPEILEDAVTAKLSDMAFRLFVACITLADDYGRLRAEPGWIRGQVYWSREVHMDFFTVALAELEPLVQFYELGGQRYAQIRNWDKHQRVDKPGKPRIPAAPEESRATLAEPSRESPECVEPDLGSRIIGSRISDLGPPMRAGAREEGPRVVGPDGDSGQVFSAWRSGIAKALKKSEPISALRGSEKQDLVALANAHAGGRTDQALLEWVFETAQAFVAANEARYGYTPVRCKVWLDSDRPNNRAGPRNANQIVQTGRVYEVPKEMP